MSKLIYLASPYSHPDPMVKEMRYEQALQATVELMKQGHVIFSPIVHSHPVAVLHDFPGNWEFWKTIDEVFISKSDELWVLMLDGWKESIGVNAEIQIAQAQGKPVVYLNAEGERQ